MMMMIRIRVTTHLFHLMDRHCFIKADEDCVAANNSNNNGNGNNNNGN